MNRLVHSEVAGLPPSRAKLRQTAIAVSGVTADFDGKSPEKLAARKNQEQLFTPAVRRDIYAFLLNPIEPGVAPTVQSPAATAAVAAGRIPFEVALLAKSSKGSTQAGLYFNPNDLDTFAFIDRPKPQEQLPPGWILLEDCMLLSAVSNLGTAAALPLAATEAFEQYLAKKASSWGANQAAHFSLDFLLAFGVELTPRLDIHHRIRSQQLTEAEIAFLTAPPAVHYLDQSILRHFQVLPPALKNKDASTFATPQPSLVKPLPMALPCLPSNYANDKYPSPSPTPTSVPQLLVTKQDL